MDGAFDLTAGPPSDVPALRPLPGRIAIAVPARNEQARLPRLLSALAAAAEFGSCPVSALVLANNCTDDTARVARAFRHPALAVETVETVFPPGQANAGRARRLAMDLAWRPDALLMTTDGDATPAPGFVAAALRHVAQGADLVCGTIGTDARHVLATPSGARIAAAEGAYGALVHEIRHCIDRMAGRQRADGDRPHYTESGAAIAIRGDAYAAIGGLPPIASSEDRALIHQAERHRLRIRYAPDMHAHVSARLFGRARGGMAECLRRRMTDPDPLADQAMLPLSVLRRLWAQAVASQAPLFPDRAVCCGPRLHASDLERRLPGLRDFVERRVRPEFARWMNGAPARAVA